LPQVICLQTCCFSNDFYRVTRCDCGINGSGRIAMVTGFPIGLSGSAKMKNTFRAVVIDAWRP
jgi:hypothetical protein